MMIDYDAYATMILARDDIADLSATRDADELITHLLGMIEEDKILRDINYYFGPGEFTTLRATMKLMILSPND